VGRVLHDRTADRMAGLISRIPHAVATIVPFDVRSRVESLAAGEESGRAAPAAKVMPGTAVASPPPRPDGGREAAGAPGTSVEVAGPAGADDAATEPVNVPDRGQPSRDPDQHSMRASDGSDYDRPVPPAGVSPIGSLTKPGRAVVEGRVHTVEIRPVEQNTVLACDVADSTGELTALFYGRSNIPGLRPGSKIRLRGPVGIREGSPVMINPAYELLAHSDSSKRPGKDKRRDS
jgi:hypothetical protein